MLTLESPVWCPLGYLGDSFYSSLFEASIGELEKEVHRGFPRTTKRQYSVQMVDIKAPSFVPYVGVNTLLVTAKALGEEHDGNRKWYNPMILFVGVEYRDSQDKDTVTVVYKDKEYYFVPPDLNETDTRVRCNCPDFLFRFSYYNHRKKSLYGSPFIYKRKTRTRPPVNPLKVVGACKHVFKLAVVLLNSGIISR